MAICRNERSVERFLDGVFRNSVRLSDGFDIGERVRKSALTRSCVCAILLNTGVFFGSRLGIGERRRVGKKHSKTIKTVR